MPRSRVPGDWLIRPLLHYRRTVVSIVFLVGAVLSVSVFLVDWRKARLDVEEAFQTDAAEHFGMLRREMEDAVNGASSLADFFQTVGSVGRGQFQEFALPHLARAPGLLALVWAPRVEHSLRARFEAAGRQEWGSDFRLFEQDAQGNLLPAGRRAEYFPVYYLETLAELDKAKVIGHDWGAKSVRLEALERARDTGRPAMTAILRMITGEKGVHVYWAIYRRGAPRNTIGARRENLRGFVGALFRIDQLVESSLGLLSPRGIDIAVVDEGAPVGEQALYYHSSSGDNPPHLWFGERLIEGWIRSGLHWRGRLDVGGRRWTVTLTPTPGYVSTHVSWEQWEDLLLGLVSTGFVGGYLLLIMRRTGEVERLVASRTKELEEARDRLLVEIGERRAAEALARRLAQQVLSVQEQERRYLSHELHEKVSQALTALVIDLALVHEDVPGEQPLLRQRLRRARASAQATVEEIRLLARDLRPTALDTLGLNANLEGLCHEVSRRTDRSIVYAGAEVSPLPDEIAICLYRILQEVLTIVVQHSQGDRFRVTLQHDVENVVMSVEDDGRGFGAEIWLSPDRSPRSLGLLGMQERLELLGGRLEIVSRSGGGTRLVATVPAGQPACVDGARSQ
jgi:signal transduction histidine kinase/sensor domain CHASE-containing protein